MRVLLISDVHANWPALKKVVEEVEYSDFVIHAGDSVGYFPFPNECVSWLKDHADVNVMGNHDYGLVNKDFTGFSTDAIKVLSWTDEHISIDNLKYLSNLKDVWTGNVGGVKIGVVHGGLTDHYNEFISPYADESLMNDYLKRLGVQALITGHTHQMFVREVKEGLIINPGSVSLPRDGDPRPSYIIMEISSGRIIKIVPKRFEYDKTSLKEKIRKEFLPSFIEE